MTDKKDRPPTPPPSWTVWAAIAFVAILWAANWWWVSTRIASTTEQGQFGDMFGAVNALFSGLAFALLIYGTWMQRIELAMQRQELEETRAELKGQKQALQNQDATLALQRFESTFFQLLNLHGQIVDAIDLVNEHGQVTRSRDCFKVFYKRLGSIQAKAAENPADDDPLSIIKAAYRSFFQNEQAEIGHYFRNLYHIVKFVKESPIEEKRRYTNFIRAQLSVYELALLFYNGLSEFGNEKFKPLIEEFALLKNLPPKILLQGSLHRGLYPPSAYDD